MIDDELRKKYDELERKRAAGLIKEDEYWSELRILDREIESRGPRIDESLRVARGFAEKALLAFLPIAVVAFIAYIALFYYPAPEDVNMTVTGRGIIPASRGEKETVYRAVELLKMHSPNDYAFLAVYVEKIEVAGPSSFAIFGGRNVGSYTPAWGGKTIRLTRGFECPAHCTSEPWTGRDLFLASILVHEACHSMQFNTGADFSEPQCYGKQFQFVKKTGPILWSDFREEEFVYEHPGSALSF